MKEKVKHYVDNQYLNEDLTSINISLYTTFRAISVYFWTLPNLFSNPPSVLTVT